MRYAVLIINSAFSRRSWALPTRLPALQRYVHTTVVEPRNEPSRDNGTEDVKEGGTNVGAGRLDEVGEQEIRNSQLPLSPLMDPKLQAARNRHRTRKPNASREPSEFQKKLRRNPYGTITLQLPPKPLLNLPTAQALATPTRSCALTGIRLPNYFLVDFGLTPHPRTGKPWQMPKLATDRNIVSLQETPSLDNNLESMTSASSEDHTDFGATSKGRQNARTVAGSHVISHRPALKLMCSLKHRTLMYMIPQRWKQDGRFKAEEIVWRKDMDTFILDLMRRKTMNLLKYLNSQPAAYIVACEGYQDVENKHQAGAVLWLGERRHGSDLTSSNKNPPPYGMVKYKSSGHIPIYNLPALFGSGYLNQLRNAGKPFDGTIAVIKRKRNTAEVQLQLWKLMGYMASDLDMA
ncbi:MAG: hypothetical protein Q9218_000463 [Villophora microphyllina]